MKWGLKYLLMFCILMLSGYVRLDAQPCLPNGIVFTTQSQIDNFPRNYPNCTDLEGWVNILGNDITNLDSLIQLESIGYHIIIDNVENLISIEGLGNISHIGTYINITNNPLLSSLSGLNIDSCYFDFWIGGNDALTDMSGLENLSYGGDIDIVANPSLTNLNGLESLTSVNSIDISGKNLESLSGLSNLHFTYDFFRILASDSLQNLYGLENLDSVGGKFHLGHNPMLRNIESLNNLRKVGGVFWLTQNNNLESLIGLNSLSSIGSTLSIFNCTSLVTLTGLDSLISIGTLHIANNSSLQTLAGIDNIEAESISYLEIYENPQLSTCEVQSICDYLAIPYSGSIIYENDTGCNSDAEIEEACIVGIPEQGVVIHFSTYPNPFTTSTTLSYTLDKPTTVTIRIFNSQGQRIEEIDLKQPKGQQQIQWNAEGLPPGMYYFRIQAGDKVGGGKMVKISDI